MPNSRLSLFGGQLAASILQPDDATAQQLNHPRTGDRFKHLMPEATQTEGIGQFAACRFKCIHKVALRPPPGSR